jgi:DNA polymerase-3 subunit gamma/tau
MALEVVMIKLLNIRPALPIDDLINRIDDLQKTFTSGKPTRPNEKQFSDDPAPESAQKVNSSETSALPSQPKKDKMAQGEKRSQTSKKDAWQAIKDIISERYPSLAPNLTHSRLKNLTQSTLEIEVNGSIFNEQRMRSKENIKILENITKSFFGRNMKVVLLAGTNKNGKPKRERIDAANRLKQELLQHPLVADAIDIFNGRLVDIKTE